MTKDYNADFKKLCEESGITQKIRDAIDKIPQNGLKKLKFNRKIITSYFDKPLKNCYCKICEIKRHK